jgi:hypothetical protein
MNICQACVHVNAREADAMLAAGATQASVARFLRIDRQILGRHVRKGHVVRGNPAAGKPWSKVEDEDEVIEMPEAFNLAVEDLVYRLHGVDPADVEEHRRHVAANAAAQDWVANMNDDCPASSALAHPAVDALAAAVETYALVVDAPLARIPDPRTGSTQRRRPFGPKRRQTVTA